MREVELKLPGSDELKGRELICPIEPVNGVLGWDIFEVVIFDITYQSVLLKDKCVSWLVPKVSRVEQRWTRPTNYGMNPCLCSECMKVHGDREFHSKTVVLWKREVKEKPQ